MHAVNSKMKDGIGNTSFKYLAKIKPYTKPCQLIGSLDKAL